MLRLPRDVRPILARQEGLISRAQAFQAGMTKTQIRTRLERGDWAVIHPAVYRSTEHELSTAVSVRAASLWAGPTSQISGHTAAWWWEMTDQPPGWIEVTVPRTVRRRPQPRMRLVRRDLTPRDQAMHRGIPITGLALSALYGAVGMGPSGPAMLDRALQRRVQLADLQAAHQRNLGAHGSPAAGRLLKAAADGAAALSERMLIVLLKKSGISGWKVNPRVSVGGSVIHPDVAFLAEGVAVEVDGWAWHHAPDRFQRDRSRQNALVGAGWIVLRFTWFDLTNRPDEVIQQIELAVHRRRLLFGPSEVAQPLRKDRTGGCAARHVAMGITRRAALLGGAGAVVLAVGGGVGLVEAGVLPGRARLDATLGWDGGGGTVPDIEPGPSISGSFRSAARRTTVGYSILRPPGQTGTLPMAVVLHGKSVNHTEAVTGLHYDRYLAAAVAGGVPPFALVTVDGGDTVYWHKRKDGDDPLTMIRDELLPIVAKQGLRTDRIGVTGWSMGGYGALLIGGQLGAAKVSAVAAISPALFADYASSSAGSYDSEADFEANDPRTDPARLDGIEVLIDCGTDDPFADQAQAMRGLVHPAPAGAMTSGAHTAAYMTRVAPEQMAFLGKALHTA